MFYSTFFLPLLQSRAVHTHVRRPANCWRPRHYQPILHVPLARAQTLFAVTVWIFRIRSFFILTFFFHFAFFMHIGSVNGYVASMRHRKKADRPILKGKLGLDEKEMNILSLILRKKWNNCCRIAFVLFGVCTHKNGETHVSMLFRFFLWKCKLRQLFPQKKL